MKPIMWAARLALALMVPMAPRVLAAEVPGFQVDPFWTKPLPNNWIRAEVAGVAVGTQDHVWIIQRPPTLTDDEDRATLNQPGSHCCVPAPPVTEFTAEGEVVQ